MSVPRRLGVLASGALLLTAGLAACSSVATAEVGTCTNLDDLSGEITEIPAVDCESSHDAEVYHVAALDDGDYPGDDEIEQTSDQLCYDAFEPYVGAAYEESELEYWVIPPNEETWTKADDREVICVAGSSEPVEESFSGSGL